MKGGINRSWLTIILARRTDESTNNWPGRPSVRPLASYRVARDPSPPSPPPLYHITASFDASKVIPNKRYHSFSIRRGKIKVARVLNSGRGRSIVKFSLKVGMLFTVS